MIEDIKDAKEQLVDYFGSKIELKEATENEVYDAISELADSNCDIYTADILEWAKGNYSKIEEATDEMGNATTSDGKADFIKTIQQGQYLANQELLDKAREGLGL